MMIFGFSPMRSTSTMPDASTRSETRKAIVAGVEIRRLFRQVRADAGQIGAAVFVGRGGDSLRQHVEGSAIECRFRRCRFGGGRFGAATASASFCSPAVLSTSK